MFFFPSEPNYFIQFEMRYPVQDGTVGDRWAEEKESFDFEAECKFKIDDCGFFISWKSDGKVINHCLFNREQLLCCSGSKVCFS